MNWREPWTRRSSNSASLSFYTEQRPVWRQYVTTDYQWCRIHGNVLFCEKFHQVDKLTPITILNYPNTTKKNRLFIDVSASHRKPSSGLTFSAGHQYVKACPICGSVGSSPRLDSCSPSSWSISPPLYVCQLCLILHQSPWHSPSLMWSRNVDKH